MKSLRPIGYVLALSLCSALPAHAQTSLDASKITCEQWLTFKVADPDYIAIWLSGWYHSKKNNPVLEVQQFKADIGRLKDLCVKKLDVPLMKVIQEQIDAKK